MGWRNEAELYREDDRKVIAREERRVDYEEPQTTPSGETIWLQTSKIPLRKAAGNVIGVMGTYTDITPRKRAEQERQRLLAELEAKNAELEGYAYTISHDLRSPLVTIRCFAGLLRRDLAKGNAAAAQQSLERIDHAATQMGALLEDLLEISRVGRIIKAPQDVDLRVLIDEAVHLCSGRIRDQGIELRIADELPAVRVDGGRIVQAFQNLIDNACKYMGHQATPWIAIDTRKENDEIVIVVRDNGIGIKPRYHDRIFRLFEKLDPSSEGDGIGLALVKRIIEVHGGRIWIESNGTGSGTAFCLTLPPATPPSHP